MLGWWCANALVEAVRLWTWEGLSDCSPYWLSTSNNETGPWAYLSGTPWCYKNIGVTNTLVLQKHDRIARHIFWLSMKSLLSAFIRSCRVCKLAGKPNQVISQVPLQPIPVIGQPFENLILDCVGPLPKAKSGDQYILTIMCTAMHYLEAVPLRSRFARAL